MKAIRPHAACLSACVALAACVPQSTPPTAPAQAPPVNHGPAIPATTSTQDWRDAPLTPGSWRWQAQEQEQEQPASTATFGAALVVSCDRAKRTVTLAAPALQGALTVVTTDVARRIGVSPVSLPAADPLLDAMAFTRGRFTIVGERRLIVPAGPELARVVEDCR